LYSAAAGGQVKLLRWIIAQHRDAILGHTASQIRPDPSLETAYELLNPLELAVQGTSDCHERAVKLLMYAALELIDSNGRMFSVGPYSNAVT
jgi:hypothetical protein